PAVLPGPTARVRDPHQAEAVAGTEPGGVERLGPDRPGHLGQLPWPQDLAADQGPQELVAVRGGADHLARSVPPGRVRRRDVDRVSVLRILRGQIVDEPFVTQALEPAARGHRPVAAATPEPAIEYLPSIRKQRGA